MNVYVVAIDSLTEMIVGAGCKGAAAGCGVAVADGTGVRVAVGAGRSVGVELGEIAWVGDRVGAAVNVAEG